ncbi:DNA primase [Serratia phage Scapp]|uniref:DNA primase n=1 Tax=Serratia phage Scapp TaxID=2282409 RepID=A0A345L6T5_9CAUD|nr:DNA primase [Serratia phage Scapp]AXH50987.1 DNA primase [Serratia phage Scapp]
MSKYLDEWEHFKGLAGRGALLPIAQEGTVDPKSRIKSELPFKIPSMENKEGYVVGFGDWAEKQTTSGQYAVWSRKYGLGIRTGHELPGGGFLVGVDVDIENSRVQSRVYDALCELTGRKRLPYRHRGNGRRLYMLACEESHTKAVLKTKRGNVDMLGLGQQFVAAGAHPSGGEYEWSPRMPRRVPVVDYDELVEAITRSARVISVSTERDATTYEASDDEDEQRANAAFAEVIEWLEDNADDCRHGTDYYFKSPDDSEYSSPSHEGDFMVRRPGANGFALPNVTMVHASDIENAGETEQEKWEYFCDLFDVPEFKRVYKNFVKKFKKRNKSASRREASIDDFEDIADDEVASPTNIIDPKDRAPLTVKSDLDEMKDSERANVLRRHYGKQVMRDAKTKMVHVYNGAVWQMLEEDMMIYDMTRIFNHNDTPFDDRDLTGAVKVLAKSSAPLPVVPQHLIGFTNGVFDMNEHEFRPHDVDDFLRLHNGIEWTPPKRRERLRKHAPNFYKWMMWAVENDKAKATRLMAAMFMILTRRYDWQLFIEITGVGGSGKSVFSNICELLAGKENSGAADLDMLANAAARVALVGKSLVKLDEAGSKRNTGEWIKKITGGDTISFNPKFLPAFDERLYAVVVAVNNKPMQFTEDNGAIARRRVVFTFDKQVPASERDVKLSDKIAAELPVIVRHLFNTFEDSDTAKELLQDQMQSEEAQTIAIESNSFAQFLQCVDILRESPHDKRRGVQGVWWNGRDPETLIPHMYLYDAYKKYCAVSGIKFVLELAEFRRKVKEAMRDAGHPYNVRRSNGKDYINVKYNATAAQYFRLDGGEDDAEHIKEEFEELE